MFNELMTSIMQFSLSPQEIRYCIYGALTLVACWIEGGL